MRNTCTVVKCLQHLLCKIFYFHINLYLLLRQKKYAECDTSKETGNTDQLVQNGNRDKEQKLHIIIHHRP